MCVDSSRIKASMALLENNDVIGVEIHKDFGFQDDNLEFLANYPEIKRLVVASKIADLNGLAYLEKLEYLMLSEGTLPKSVLAETAFPCLKHFRGGWSPDLINLFDSAPLSRLYLYGAKLGSHGLKALSGLSKLQHLELVRGDLSNLNNLCLFPTLRILDLAYLPKLTSLQGISASSMQLRELHLENCPNIEDFHELGKLSYLKVLSLNSCKSIDSIQFISHMRALASFRFVHTNVVDGDLSPCLNLKYVGSFNKRHYLPSVDEIKKKIGQSTK